VPSMRGVTTLRMNRLTRSLLASAATTACLSAQDPPKPGTPPPVPPIAQTNPAAKPDAPPMDIQWKDLVRKGFPIKFYGFFRLDTYYNSARMDNVIIPTRVLAETEGTPGAGEAKRNDDQFAMDPRLTRLGLDISGPDVEGVKTTGKLEMDFANFPTGSAESRATPRIRLAYADLKGQHWGMRVGQDWDIVSPLFPSVNGETLMWNAGNTGDRRAQIQGRWTDAPDPKNETVGFKVMAGLTGAINNEDLDSGTLAGERDGFDSGTPQLQSRLGWRAIELVEGKRSDIGLWGMYGRTQTDTFFAGEDRFDTWLAGIDITLPISGTLTIRAEAWTGTNLGDIRGGMGQTINTATGEEIASSGGWAELVCACTTKTQVHAGASLDDPKNDDLSTTLASANRRRNQAAWLGTAMNWDNGLRTGLDVIYWQSDYMGANGTNGSSGNGLRFDLYFQFDF
jgi:hypothetical protein